MNRGYDRQIEEHYKGVAKEQGLLSTSTMADEIIRNLETDAIVQFLRAALKDCPTQAIVMDVGCGNGYTLEKLSKQFPNCQFIGVEKSNDLRALASSRFSKSERVKIVEGDIRQENFSKGIQADVLICQRVIINILSLEDQKQALQNILNVLKPKAHLIFIECFEEALEKLNVARSEFGLEPLPPAHHNMYLPSDFFSVAGLRALDSHHELPPANFLSTHYYITRVLHPYFNQGKPFKHNSEFVKFLSGALKPGVGDYAPLKACIFRKG